MRNNKGRFSSFKSAVKRFMFRRILPAAVLIGIGFAVGGATLATSSVSYATREVKVDGTPERIEKLKGEVIDRLQACESGGHNEASGLIVFDSNKVASLGVMQWQVKSVQHYAKTLRQHTLSGKEAIALAFDQAEARKLATEVIFDTDKGLSNWLNCANKLGLAAEVTVIKKLAQ